MLRVPYFDLNPWKTEACQNLFSMSHEPDDQANGHDVFWDDCVDVHDADYF
jgi:hypothetical protein